MLMPLLRLIGIYLVVGLVIFGLFNRDKIGALFISGNEATAIEEVATQEQSSEIATNTDATPLDNSIQSNQTQEQATTQNQQTIQTQHQPSNVVASAAQQTANQPAANQQTLYEQQAGFESRLDDARRAYWNGYMNSAEEIYRKLVQDYPNSVDANGELGNILFTTQRFDDAALYYYAVGEISHRAGNNAQLMNMIGVLQGIAPEKAQQLRTLAGARPTWPPTISRN